MDDKINLFNNWIKENFKDCWDMPGLAICIFDDEEIIYKKAFGYANIKTKRKLKINDKFCIASCSKSIVCLAITLAVKAKEIPNIWEMTLGNVYHNTNISTDYSNVLVKNLATHTSGITDFNDCPKKMLPITKYENIVGFESRKIVSKILLGEPAHYKPGSKFKYSNIGYGILAGIVEKYTGEDYTNIVEKYIFKPLKIKANYKIYYTGDGYAEGHKYDGLIKNAEYKPLGKNEHVNPTYEEPSGEIYLSIGDSAKYLQEYLKASKNKSSIMTKSIYKNQINPFMENYGLGWINKNNEIITHSGGYFNTYTQYAIYLKKSLGIVININANSGYIKYTINNKFEEIFIN
jgi:CubicO group peptidase (beta-lactamase class C family)